jgi:hypothetical protein
VTWLAGARDVEQLLQVRGTLGELVEGLRAEAAAAAPGRTAELIDGRARQMIVGDASLEAFGQLTAAEQVVVEITDSFLFDAHAIDDALFARLGEHYTPAEQVGLLFHLALADGFTRMARVFDAPEEAR